MPSPEDDIRFQKLSSSLEEEAEALKALRRSLAFYAEPRPIPEGLIPDGPPAGHIAFMGDFEPKNDDK